MPLIRGIEQILADFDKRQRPDARSHNKTITKFGAVNDTVTLSSDAVTVSRTAGPYIWYTAGSTATSIVWGEQGEFSS